MTRSPVPKQPRSWEDLAAAEQLRLREAYGRYLDTLPRTCDLNVKVDRFRAWLADRGVHFDEAP